MLEHHDHQALHTIKLRFNAYHVSYISK